MTFLARFDLTRTLEHEAIMVALADLEYRIRLARARCLKPYDKA